MNLQRIERLKGLLARVQSNAKSPRVAKALQDTMSEAPILSAATSSAGVERARTFELDLATVPKVAPIAAAPAEPAKKPISIAPAQAAVVAPVEVARARAAITEEAIHAPRPKSVPPAVPSWPSSEAAASAPAPIEDVSAEEVGLEDVSLDEIGIEVSPLPPASVAETAAQPRAKAQASALPYTAAPSLDELTFSLPPPPQVGAPSSIPPQPVVEEAPASIDAALMAATEAQAQAEELEAPLLTPPPESGRQPARPLAAESQRGGPTAEQLGEVLELEEATGPTLELAPRPKVVAKSEPAEELEYIPEASARSTAQQIGAEQPSQAEVDPSSSRRVVTGLEAPKPSEPTIPVSEADFEQEEPTATIALSKEVSARRVVVPSKPVIDVVAQVRAFRPGSFLELLDASLKLGR